MVGILAGIRGTCEMGDIIAAESVWDWGSGKHSVEQGSSMFGVAPQQIGISSYIRGRLSLLAQAPNLLDEIRRSWPGDKPSTSLAMHLGPVASGASVLADKSMAEAIKQHNRKIIGVEMELYGAFTAADEAPLPVPKIIGIKSVCDFADETKEDRFQKYAAYTSAQALRTLMENFIK